MTIQKGKVAYICGSAHSGSTLLSLLLGSHPGMISLGEIAQTVRKMHMPASACTCGEEARKCPVWGQVLEAVGSLPAERRLFAAVDLLLERTRPATVVDSSKGLPTLKDLLSVDGLEVRAIHLIRDGRAVACSNRKKDRSLIEAGRNWDRANREIRTYLSSYVANGYLTVRYEDLVTEPAATVEKTLRFLDHPVDQLRLNWTDGRHHHLRGNRMRFAKEAAIIPDIEYLESLGPGEWDELTGMLAPTLTSHAYGLTIDGMRDLLSTPSS
jgi:hypothetical protein